jgi:hypothetical protein
VSFAATLNQEELSKAVAELELQFSFSRAGADFDDHQDRWIELVRRAEAAAAVAEITRVINNLGRLLHHRPRAPRPA